MDIFHGFWQKFAELAQNGSIFSSVKVREEIERGNDDLKQWCRDNLPSSFFLPFDESTSSIFANLMQWASASTVYTEAAKQEFATVADAFVVATAAARQMKVVTFETPDPNCRRRVKIPDACEAFDVAYCSLNDVLHELGITI